MAYNKEELLALLKFIKQVCGEEENKWFKEELIKDLGCQQGGNPVLLALGDGLNSRVSDIEKYLGLDYKLDNAKSIIDYSRIIDSTYRIKLVQDNQEMLRYRYGTRNHKIDFDEFCKFAHFQAEALLNYFYERVEDNISGVIEYIQSYMPPNFHIFNKEKIRQVSDISYNYKKIAFCGEFNSYDAKDRLGSDFSTILDHIRQVRNMLSHRAGAEDKKWKQYFKQTILKSGLPVKDEDFDRSKIRNSPDWETYKNKYSNDKEYSEYRFRLWLDRKPFDEVILALAKMAQKIQLRIVEV